MGIKGLKIHKRLSLDTFQFHVAPTNSPMDLIAAKAALSIVVQRYSVSSG